MDEALIQLLMDAGQASGREDVPGDVQELLRKLAAAAVTGEAESDAGDVVDPPAAESPPGEKPTDAPAERAALAAMSPAARKALKSADDLAKQAEGMARKRLDLETAAAREAAFRAAPDVFPEALPKLRELYQSAPLDEVERFVAAQRAQRAGGAGGGGSGQFRNRDSMREPQGGKGALPVKNEGGVAIKGAGI
jgi:hypothetical protein